MSLSINYNLIDPMRGIKITPTQSNHNKNTHLYDPKKKTLVYFKSSYFHYFLLKHSNYQIHI